MSWPAIVGIGIGVWAVGAVAIAVGFGRVFRLFSDPRGQAEREG